MKKTIAGITLCFASISAFGQRQGLWITPSFNMGYSVMKKNLPEEFLPKRSIIYSAGIESTYMITNNIGIGTGLSYARYISKWEYDSWWTNELFTISFSQGNLDIPIFFRIVTGRKSGFFAHIGFIHHFLMDAKYTEKRNDFIYLTEVNAKEIYASYSTSPFLYLGGNLRCGNYIQMTLGAQLSYQSTDNFAKAFVAQGRHLGITFKAGLGIQAYKRMK